MNIIIDDTYWVLEFTLISAPFSAKSVTWDNITINHDIDDYPLVFIVSISLLRNILFNACQN